MVLVGIDAGSDPWQGRLDWRRPLQVGAEDAQLRTLWTDIGETPMTDQIEPKNSTYFLRAAIDVQAERGKQYDAPDGERSMGRTVQAFNAITGRDLTEAEGWLLLQVLKDVRQWQNPDKFHEDSALDGVAYSSLKAEALAAGGRP